MNGLSVCIAVYNRSRYTDDNGKTHLLFPRCIESIAKAYLAVPEITMEVVIGDSGSTDWRPTQWISKYIGLTPCMIVHTPAAFAPDGQWNRGKCLNPAVKAARYENLLLLEADFLIGPQLLQRSIYWLNKGFSFSPYYRKLDQSHKTGPRKWLAGMGNIALTKDTFYKVGGWPEKDNIFGCDQHIPSKIKGLALPFARERAGILDHIEHPGHLSWPESAKQRFYAKNTANKKARERIRNGTI